MQKLEQLRDAWVAACLAFDEPAAESVFQQGLTAFPPETVCLEILRAGLAWMGEAWYRGDATVHQEHFASHLAARQVQMLLVETLLPFRSDPILRSVAGGVSRLRPSPVDLLAAGAGQSLGEDGAPLLEWLERQSANF